MSNAGLPNTQWTWNAQYNDYVAYDSSRRCYITRRQYASDAANNNPSNPRTPHLSGPSVTPGFSYSGSPPTHTNYVPHASTPQPWPQHAAAGPSHYTERGAPAAGPSSAGPSGLTPQTDQVGYDRRSKVRSIIQRGPPEAITDPFLLQGGKPARGYLKGTGVAVQEKLYPDFRVPKKPRSFFRVGRVFIVLWAEPAGQSGKTETTLITEEEVTDRRFGSERIFSKVRRFVVVRESDRSCSALPIVSYGNQGVAKEGETKSDHGIIYIGRQAPSPSPSEAARPGEAEMQSWPVRVDPESPHEKLEAMSRINYGKVYTVEHNVKVRCVGTVHPHSLPLLLQQFQIVWFKGQAGPDLSVQGAGAERQQVIAALMQRGYTHQQAVALFENRKKQQQPNMDGQVDDESSDEDDESNDEEEEQATGASATHHGHGNEDNTDEQDKAEVENRHKWERAIKALQGVGYSKEQAVAMLQERHRQASAQVQTTARSEAARGSSESEVDSGSDDDESSGDEQQIQALKRKESATLSTLQQHGLSRPQAVMAIRNRSLKEEGRASQGAPPTRLVAKGKAPDNQQSQTRQPKSDDDRSDDEEEESADEDESDVDDD